MDRTLINNHIYSGRLAQAIELLKASAERPTQEKWRDQLNGLGETYHYLLDYLQKGVPDEGRESLINTMKKKLLVISDRLYRDENIRTSTHKYYTEIKLNEARGAMTVESLLEECNKPDSLSFGSNSVDNSTNFLFCLLWTSLELSPRAQELITQASLELRLVSASALTLSLLHYWDESKVVFMLRELLRPDMNEEYAVRLLFGLLVVFNRHRQRLELYKEDFDPLIEEVQKTPDYKELLTAVWRGYTTAIDTERLTEEMRSSLPNLFQTAMPKLQELMGDSNEINLEKLSESGDPELQELERKLHKLGALRDDSADTMYLSFMEMKHDDFFSELTSWFLPFSTEQTRVRRILDNQPSVTPLLKTLEYKLCDSDLYSFVFALNGMREGAQMLISGMPVNLSELVEEGEQSRASLIKRAAQRYVTNFYRFSKLYRYHNQFFDPFEKVCTIDTPLLRSGMDTEQLLMESVQYLFPRHHYEALITMLGGYAQFPFADRDLFLYLAYCEYSMDNYRQAIKHFKQADLIQDLPLSAHRKVAMAYRRIKDYAAAMALYERLIEQYPDELELSFDLASLLINNGRFAEALPHLYKYEFSVAQPLKAQRFVAWCLLLTKDFEGATRYYKEILTQSTNKLPSDYLNAGYTAVAKGDTTNAIALFREAALLYPEPAMEHIYTEVEQDLPQFEGVFDTSSIYMLIDGALALNRYDK